MNKLQNYVFVIPKFMSEYNYMMENMQNDYFESDGSPLCKIRFGWLLEINNPVIDDKERFIIYKISDKYKDIESFDTDFIDGECIDEDFILIN